MERPGKNIWSHLSLEKKILLAVTLMILTLFISNIFIYLQVNKIAGKMDTVYASNVNLSAVSYTHLGRSCALPKYSGTFHRYCIPYFQHIPGGLGRVWSRYRIFLYDCR